MLWGFLWASITHPSEHSVFPMLFSVYFDVCHIDDRRHDLIFVNILKPEASDESLFHAGKLPMANSKNRWLPSLPARTLFNCFRALVNP